MELKKRQASLANDPKDLRKDVDAGEQQTNCSKDKSDSADEETLVLWIESFPLGISSDLDVSKMNFSVHLS